MDLGYQLAQASCADNEATRQFDRPEPAELLHLGEDVNDFDRKVKVGENPVEPCEHFPRMPSGCRERTIVSDCCV